MPCSCGSKKGKMINLTIDNKKITVPEGTSLIEAARMNGIDIPSLCYKKGLPYYTSCMICMVKDKNNNRFIPSCTASVADGMDIEATGDEIDTLRRQAIELLLSEHRAECEAPCSLVCPMGLDIPAMNRLVAKGDFMSAALMIQKELILPLVACTICPGYCENACRRKMIDEKIAIREIIKYTYSLVDSEEAMSKKEARLLLPGFNPDEALSGIDSKDKNAIRNMAEAKRKGAGTAGDSEKGEKVAQKKRFNSTLGKITDDEKKEWLKESGQGSARWQGPQDVEQLMEEAAACMHCDCRAKDDCRLRELSEKLGARNPRIKLVSHPIKKKISKENKLIFENAKCIKCGLCIRVSPDQTNNPSLCFTGRGSMTLVSEPLTVSFENILKNGIEDVVNICPTGALGRIDR